MTHAYISSSKIRITLNYVTKPCLIFLHLPVNALISGNSNLSIEENATVFDSVLAFITLTGPFT